METIQQKILELLEAVRTGADINEKAALVASYFDLIKVGDRWHINQKKLTEKDIINKVSEYTSISVDEMNSKLRTHEIVRARYLAMVEIRKCLGFSYSAAAAVFNLNHATGVYAEKQLQAGIIPLPNIITNF